MIGTGSRGASFYPLSQFWERVRVRVKRFLEGEMLELLHFMPLILTFSPRGRRDKRVTQQIILNAVR